MNLSLYGDESHELFDLSLHELTNEPITIASKRVQSKADAPGVITVITAAEIAQFGARNLHDVMRLIPEVQQVYPQFTHRSAIAMRGQIAGAIDKYFLILINGKPMRDPILYGVNAPIYEGIPLNLVERIEIVRGPGSVMYGSNAFAGVMDIITKQENETDITLSYGEHNSATLDLATSFNVTEELAVTLAYRNFTTDGWPLSFIDTGGNQDTFRNENTSYGAYAKVSYQDFNFEYFDAKVEEVATLSNGLINDVVIRPSDRTFYSVDYEWLFSSNWSNSLAASLNRSNIAASTEYDAEDGVIAWSSHGEFDHYSLDLGLNIRNNTLYDTQNKKVSDVTYKSGYLQLNYQLNELHALVAGIQVLDPEKSDIQFAPRVSYLYNDESINAKVNYGRAYASPTGVEFSLDIPGLFLGNPSLVPTTNDTYDAILSYTQENYSISSSVFYSDIKHNIVLQDVTPGQPLPKQFQNSSGQTHRGITVDGVYRFSDFLQFNWAYSYQYAKDSKGQKNAIFLSERLFKTGVVYQYEKLSVATYSVYHSAPRNRQIIINDFNPKEDNFNHVTVNLNYDISQYLHFMKSASVFLYIDNLLNSDAEFLPDPTLSNLNTLPKVSARSFYAGLKIQF